MLAENNHAARNADAFGRHDFVSHGVLQHAVLMNAGFVRKSIGADDRFIHLDLLASQFAEHLARTIQLLGFETRRDIVVTLPRIQRHHDLLQRRVPSPLADAVDRAFHLTSSVLDRGKTVRYREAEVVVAVRADRDAFGILEPLAQGPNQLTVFGGSLISHRVGYVHDGRARIDDGVEHGAQIVDLGATGVLRRKLHFIAKIARALDGLDGDVEGFSASLVEFVFQMNVARRQEGVDAWASRLFEGFPAAVDIGGNGAGQSSDRHASDLARYPLHSFEIAFGRDRKTCLNYVDLKPLELARHLQFLFHVHAEPGSLLSIS